MLHAGEEKIRELEARIKSLESIFQNLSQMEGGMHSNLRIASLGTMRLMAPTIDLSWSAQITLPGGGRPIARVGDTVVDNTIVGPGNPQVLG